MPVSHLWTMLIQTGLPQGKMCEKHLKLTLEGLCQAIESDQIISNVIETLLFLG